MDEQPLAHARSYGKRGSDLSSVGPAKEETPPYKWAFKLAPFTAAALTADCFALARDTREVDMRASPYDLRNLGFAPIAVETPGGRAEYEQHQRAFTARGEPLRERLIALCERLLGGMRQEPGSATALGRNR